MPIVKCKNCGKEFKVIPARASAKFCSWECYSNYMKRERNVSITCLNCGKKFTVNKARANKAKFCSIKCKAEWQSKYLRGENNPAWQGKTISRVCINCGKEFSVSQCKLTSGHHKGLFCSVRCMSEYWKKTGRFKGANNGNWNGGKIKITDDLILYLDGLILGDGYIEPVGMSARYTQGCAERYLEWLQKIKIDLKRFHIDCRISVEKRLSDILNNHQRIYYKLRTKVYPELRFFRERWYPNGYKIVPRDLEISPIVALNWYLGDGCLTKTRRENGKIKYWITLATNGFNKESVMLLIDKLRKTIKIKPVATRTNVENQWVIGIYKQNHIRRFLDYIGDPPVKCFEYKWHFDFF